MTYKPLTIKYRGRRLDSGCVIERYSSGARQWLPLPISRSLRLVNHSPTGFEWGYGGSGPAQSALAILLDFTNDEHAAVSLHQDFKWKLVSQWPSRNPEFSVQPLLPEWTLTGQEIADAIHEISNDRSAAALHKAAATAREPFRGAFPAKGGRK